MTRRSDLACIGLAGFGLLAGFPLLRAAAADVVTVIQSHRSFSVAALRIKRGDGVRFTNDDAFNHQVFVKTAAFNFESAEQAPGDTIVLTFPVTGTFDVQCEIHPRMHLAVTVE